MEEISISEARRIALAAQGFDRQRPAGRVDARHVRRVIRQLSLIQLDFVNVLIPAHYQVLYSRLGPYDRSILDKLIARGEFTEQWAHEASIVPVENWPLLRYRRENHRARPWGFDAFLDKNPEYVAWVVEQVRERGALTAESLPAPPGAPRRVHESWFGTVPRAVLEAHFGRGVLAIAGRLPGFARLYDLSDRIIAAEHHVRMVPHAEGQRELIRQAARAHGVATLADLADYYRMPAREAKPLLNELEMMGEVVPVRVEGWRERAFLHREARLPKRIEAVTLLSPFDPLIWYRPRTQRLFDFEYRFEIFVPPHKRRWGVYVLPFLMDEQLVARVDLKADRAAGKLMVLSGHLEAGTNRRKVLPPLLEELRDLAKWLQLDPPSSRIRFAEPNRSKKRTSKC